MTWEALPSQLPPPQPPLPIEIAEEGRDESDDDVEAEVWPLARRGIQHIRIRVNRDAVLPMVQDSMRIVNPMVQESMRLAVLMQAV